MLNKWWSQDLKSCPILGGHCPFHSLAISLVCPRNLGLDSYCCLLKVQEPHYLLLVRPALEKVTAVPGLMLGLSSSQWPEPAPLLLATQNSGDLRGCLPQPLAYLGRQLWACNAHALLLAKAFTFIIKETQPPFSHCKPLPPSPARFRVYGCEWVLVGGWECGVDDLTG